MIEESETTAWGRLRAALRPHREAGVIVAFSGGLDSSVLLDAALEELGPARVVAFTAVSPSFASDEHADARRIAAELGAPLHEEETAELEDPGYVANGGDRCFFCKRELFAVVERAKAALGLARVAYGYHRDDDADVRPGLVAARQAGALRPLYDAGLGKRDLRALARSRGRSFAEKPSGACLSSRIPVGMPVTAERLGKVELVEAFLRRRGYRQLRARLDRDDLVRVETDPADIARLSRDLSDPACGGELRRKARALGILEVTVDARGYRRAGEA